MDTQNLQEQHPVVMEYANLQKFIIDVTVILAKVERLKLCYLPAD